MFKPCNVVRSTMSGAVFVMKRPQCVMDVVLSAMSDTVSFCGMSAMCCG